MCCFFAFRQLRKSERHEFRVQCLAPVTASGALLAVGASTAATAAPAAAATPAPTAWPALAVVLHGRCRLRTWRALGVLGTVKETVVFDRAHEVGFE